MPALILYFSRKGNNYVNGAIKNLPAGNTEMAARMLSRKTGAELFEIEPRIAYPDDYSECIEKAMQEQKSHARPALKAYPAQLAGCDVVYLGYPNWWGTMPMPVFTLLEHCDFSGKTIKPFCTHEGSGMGSSEEDIRRACPGAIVAKGLAIHGAHVAQAEDAIARWA